MENVSFNAGFSTAIPSAPIATAHLEVPHAVILCAVLGVASVVGTFGNTLVLLSVIRFESLKAIPDLFIFSLSLSDILVTALYQPLKMYRYTNLQETNEAYLGTSSFLGYLSLIASITNVFWVTVERLVSIRRPLKYGRFVTRRRAVVTIICIWTFSVINGAIGSRRHSQFFKVYLFVYFILSITGTVSIYIYIFVVVKRLENATVAPVQNSPSSLKQHKAAKTIIIILGVALLCWLPFLILTPLPAIADPTRKIFFSLQTLSVCNSSINPYIYCARSRKYYLAFAKLLGLRRFVRVRAPVVPARHP